MTVTLLNTSEPILEVNNLKMHFPVKQGILLRASKFNKAVDGVSFQIRPGETLGLVGESGCGKSTLGRCIARLYKPTAGEIKFAGQDITRMRGRQLRPLRQDIQMIFQDPMESLNSRHTVGDILGEPFIVQQIGDREYRKKRVRELLEIVGLPARSATRYPFEFSGGQRQRICIARALALNPQFIICDESVSALDVSVQAQVLNLLNELRDDFNFTYIFISHDLSVVKFMSDRMIIMKDGKIEEIGDADEIYNNPQSDYTRKLINAIPKGELEDIKRVLKSKQTRAPVN